MKELVRRSLAAALVACCRTSLRLSERFTDCGLISLLLECDESKGQCLQGNEVRGALFTDSYRSIYLLVILNCSPFNLCIQGQMIFGPQMMEVWAIESLLWSLCFHWVVTKCTCVKPRSTFLCLARKDASESQSWQLQSTAGPTAGSRSRSDLKASL